MRPPLAGGPVLGARTLIPLGVAVLVLGVAVTLTWHLRGELDAQRHDDLKMADGLQAVREEVADLDREVTDLRALVLSERRLGDAAIEAAIRRLADARDYTRERNPRPRVDAVQRELARAGVELRITALARDRVWATMTLRDRLALLTALGGKAAPSRDPAGRPGETP